MTLAARPGPRSAFGLAALITALVSSQEAAVAQQPGGGPGVTLVTDYCASPGSPVLAMRADQAPGGTARIASSTARTLADATATAAGATATAAAAAVTGASRGAFCLTCNRGYNSRNCIYGYKDY